MHYLFPFIISLNIAVVKSYTVIKMHIKTKKKFEIFCLIFQIRVSLSADSHGICVRSFRPEIEPTSTSSIVLHYSIKSEAKDCLLLFLANSETVSFYYLISNGIFLE